MKRKIFLSTGLVAILLLTHITPTFAENNGKTAEERQNALIERKEDLAQKREEKQEQLQERKDGIQQKTQETRAEILAKHAERLRHRFLEVYYDRFTKIIEKIQNRLTFMTGEGKDVAAAQAKLTEARTQLETAKSTTLAAIEQFQAVDGENYEAQKDQALKARDLAKQARDEFRGVLILIKEAVQLAKEAK